MRSYIQNNYKKILKFLVSGGCAALVEYVVFIVLHSADVHILVANSISFLCGLVVSFSLNRLWVFGVRTAVGRQFGKYFLLALINLTLSDILVWVLVHELSITALVAKLITMMMIATWNYFIFSKLIFVTKE